MNIRIFEVPTTKLPFKFDTSKSVYNKLMDYGKADREVFLVLFLDPHNQVIDVEFHSIGDVNQNAVYPRQVFRSALLNNAISIIVAHNHPTGDVTPSINDKALTKRLVKCGELVEVKVLDHIIIGKDGYFSFSDEGLIGEYESDSVWKFFD